MKHTCLHPVRKSAVGVSYDAIHDRWVAYVCPACGKLQRKYFPCDRYGFDGAFNAARRWRERQVRRLLGDHTP